MKSKRAHDSHQRTDAHAMAFRSMRLLLPSEQRTIADPITTRTAGTPAKGVI